MTDSRKSQLFAQMHNLLDAGLDMSGMFGILLAEYKDDKDILVVKKLYNDMVNGKSFKASMEEMPCFSDLDASIVWTGEASGKLAYTLGFLSEYYSKKEKQKKMISSSMSYPIMILSFAVVVLIFMLLVIVPTFSQVYVRMGGELPVLTRIVLDLSKEAPKVLVALLVMISGLYILYRRTRTSSEFVRLKSYFLMNMPVLGKIARLDAQCSFCRLMTLLNDAGVSITDSIEIVASSLGNHHYKIALKSCALGIRIGKSLSQTLLCYPDMFSNRIVTMIRVGEETHRMGQMFAKSADMLTDELDYSIKKLITCIEPMMVLAVGGIVALILISMYLPMFRLGSIIG